MAGYRHRRRTKSATYVAANGTLKLPWAYSNSVDDDTNGVFPEFFYNFAGSDVNIDIGVVFRGTSGWHVFAWSEKNVTNKWYQKKVSLTAGQTITMAVYTEGDKVILKVNGTDHSIPVTASTAQSVRTGCKVSYEANLVPQKVTSSCSLLKTGAYFKGAVWSNVTLTTTSGAYVKMATTNTTFDNDLDNGDISKFDAKCLSRTTSTVDGFVKDDFTIDLSKQTVCP